jgi:flagellar motility protein MotE (MotC chaperone)
MCKRVPKALFCFLLLSAVSFSAISQEAIISPSAGSLESSARSSSAETMTDAEIIAELMESLKIRETQIAEREKSIQARETRLTERENDLATREKNWEERNSILTLRKQILDESENYWKNYKRDTLRREIFLTLASAGIGYLAGRLNVSP